MNKNKEKRTKEIIMKELNDLDDEGYDEKMAEEFANFMQETRRAPLEEKLNVFGDIIERMMSIILRIPDLVDQSLLPLNQKISTLKSRINTLNNEMKTMNGFEKKVEERLDQEFVRLVKDIESSMKTLYGFEKKIRIASKKKNKDKKFSDPVDFYDFSNLNKKK